MNLKTYNTETLPARTAQPGVPSIGLYSRNGIFVFNDAARQHLDLRPGEQVQLLQDEDDPENWYLQVVKSDGFVLREKQSGNYKNLVFASTALVRLVFESVAYEGKSGRVLIGEPIKHGKATLHTLITLKLRNV